MSAIHTDNPSFANELREVVALFDDGEHAQVLHMVAEMGGQSHHTVTVTLDGRSETCTLPGGRFTQEHWERKRQDGRAAKLACYRALCALTGQLQPWGSLTGVRPTALLRQLNERGEGHLFTNYYGVSAQKAALAARIIEIQDRVMVPVGPEDVCVYLCIPFCVTRCSYCSFPTRLAKKGEMEAYVEALLLEMAAAQQGIELGNRHVSTLYIGGGTPTSLPAPLFKKLMAGVAHHFGDVRELTLEAGRPDTIDEEKLSIAKDHGVTRLCVNPQSMNDETLARIGRTHSAQDIEDCVQLARKVGFESLNMDIIAGLPGETMADFAHTLERLIALSPSGLTCHTLSLKRGSELKQNAYAQTPASTVTAMVDGAAQTAATLGLAPYYLYRQKYIAGNLENVGYAKAGSECIYNIAMMDEMRDIVALGVGSVSKRLSGNVIERLANPRDLALYHQRLDVLLEQKKRFFCVDKGDAHGYNDKKCDDEDR